MTRTTFRSQYAWSTTQIDESKRQIKDELDKYAEQNGLKDKIDYAMKRQRECLNEGSQKNLLKAFIYGISILVHQERHGGLNALQTEKITKTCRLILRAQSISPGESRLSFLHSELLLITSQINRKVGEHWLSAWQQQQAIFSAGRNKLTNPLFDAFAFGIRCLRLGFMDLAIKNLTIAEEYPSQLERARLSRIKALRLKAEFSLAEELDRETVAILDQFSDSGKRELEWERICRQCQTKNDPVPFIKAVKKDSTHFEGIYLIETFFWLRCHQNELWKEHLNKISTIGRKKEIGAQKLGFFFDMALGLDGCDDDTIPLLTHIDLIGNQLSQIKQLLTIDKELLVLLACARWLFGKKKPTLGALALGEYCTLSQKLSNGNSMDVLNFGQDLIKLSESYKASG